jgi:hypothetical protein
VWDEWDFYHLPLRCFIIFFRYFFILLYFITYRSPLESPQINAKLDADEKREKLVFLLKTPNARGRKRQYQYNCNFGRLFMFRIMRLDVCCYWGEKYAHYQFREIFEIRFLISNSNFKKLMWETKKPRWSKFGCRLMR